MNNQYYRFIVHKLLELKQKGYFSNIELNESFIDPHLDVLLKSFSFIAEEIDENVEKTKSNIKIGIMRLHYEFLFRQIVSKIIMLPSVNFEQPTIFLPSKSSFQAYEKDSTYFYRSSYDVTLIPLASIESNTKYATDMDIKTEITDYFISIKFNFISGFNIAVCNIKTIRIMFYSDAIAQMSDLLLSMCNKNMKVYIKDGTSVMEVGKIKKLLPIDLEGQYDIPQYLQALVNYFHFKQSYYIFDIELNEYIDPIKDSETAELLIGINTFIKMKNFILCNFIILTNLNEVQSNMFQLQDSLKVRTYIDYLTMDVNKIYSIKNFYALDIDAAKQYSVQNFVHYACDKRYKVLDNIYWVHHVEFGEENKDYISFETFQQNVDILEESKNKLQYFYLADSYQVITRKLNIDNIVCTSNNKILFNKLVYGPSFSRNICIKNVQVLDNLFTIYNPDLIHTKNKRGILLNILNSLSYLFNSHQNFDKVIYDVEIGHEFIESVINNQYTSNILFYKIIITIEDESSISYEFYVTISSFLIGLFGITVDIHIEFTNLEQNKILYHEYSSRE